MGARAWPHKMALSCHSELVLSEAKDLAPVLSLSKEGICFSRRSVVD